MKNPPLSPPSSESAGRKSGLTLKSAQKGIALILTLTVLSMTLVLVVGYATLTRTEAISSADYRDFVNSKFVARGAMSRAMARISSIYTTNSATLNAGLVTLYSQVDGSKVRVSQLDAERKELATDIEGWARKGLTGIEYAERGPDGKIDYVILAGQIGDDRPELRPQWVGIKDDKGVLIGRMAYIISSAGLNINAIGNLVSASITNLNINDRKRAYHMTMNARNEGYSVAELNLAAAILAMATNKWDHHTAVEDARAILEYRYGADKKPGNQFAPDYALKDKRDNNGDWVVDDAADKGVGPGWFPDAFFVNSNAKANQEVIAPYGDDVLIQDLVKLKNGDIPLPEATRKRFEENFAKVQKVFSTQSRIPIAANVLNLNDTTMSAKEFYDRLNEKLAYLKFPISDSIVQRQVACNIVTYAMPETNMPYQVIHKGTNVVGIARVPFINQVLFNVELEVEKSTDLGGGDYNVAGGDFKVTVTPRCELWYPYTNACVLANKTTKKTELEMEYRFENIESGMPGLFTWKTPQQTVTDALVDFPAVKSFQRIMDDDRFADFGLGSKTLASTVPFKLSDLGGKPLTFTNIQFSVKLQRKDGSGLLDVSPFHEVENARLIIPPDEIATLIQNAKGGSAQKKKYLISFALNDPRVKLQSWLTEYVGPDDNTYLPPGGDYTSLHSIGTTNFWNAIPNDIHGGPKNSLRVFFPTRRQNGKAFAEDADYRMPTDPGQPTSGPRLPYGIAPKTFYVKNERYFSSPAELGRIHRGTPWMTINLKSGYDWNTTGDNAMLNHCTVIPGAGSALKADSYVHGRANVNARPSDIHVWAAIFCGMPIETQMMRDQKRPPVIIDYNRNEITGELVMDKAFPACREFGNMIGSAAGTFTHLGALTSIPGLSDISEEHAIFGKNKLNIEFKTDEDREYIIDRMINMVGTTSQGNVLTIWAWGQSLRGPYPKDPDNPTQVAAANANRVVGGETLVVSMVKPTPDPVNQRRFNMEVIYYRYNPDLEVNSGF
jgi:hypothetical protein